MATTTASPDGTTSPDNWTLAAGASKVAAVALPDDDATTYLNSGTTIDTVQTFTVTPSGISSGDTITQIDIAHRHRKNPAGSNVDHVTGYSFTPQGGGTQTGESGTFVAASWDTNTYTHSGLSVLWGSGLTLYIKNTQARDMYLSTISVTITYTPGGGGGGQPMVARARQVPGMRRPHGRQGW